MGNVACQRNLEKKVETGIRGMAGLKKGENYDQNLVVPLGKETIQNTQVSVVIGEKAEL